MIAHACQYMTNLSIRGFSCIVKLLKFLPVRVFDVLRIREHGPHHGRLGNN